MEEVLEKSRKPAHSYLSFSALFVCSQCVLVYVYCTKSVVDQRGMNGCINLHQQLNDNVYEVLFWKHCFVREIAKNSMICIEQFQNSSWEKLQNPLSAGTPLGALLFGFIPHKKFLDLPLHKLSFSVMWFAAACTKSLLVNFIALMFCLKLFDWSVVCIIQSHLCSVMYGLLSAFAVLVMLVGEQQDLQQFQEFTFNDLS